MKGTYRFRVGSKRSVFEFTIRRNITIIKGDSGTGKTTLLNMLYEYLRIGRESGFSVDASVSYYVYMRREVGREWNEVLGKLSNTVIFIEENNEFIFTEEFASYVMTSGNYFVFVNRTPMHMLPYSIHEIYEIVTTAGHRGLKETYHEFKELYSNFPLIMIDEVGTVITEDSNSGMEFMEKVYSRCDVVSSGGNTGIIRTIEEKLPDNILVVSDGAAFGAYIEETISTIRSHNESRIALWLPESFEYLVLKSGVVKSGHIDEVLSDPSEWIDSAQFGSWERFFTDFLMELTRDSEHPYSKKRLSVFYLSDSSVLKILNTFPAELIPESMLNR